jgi:anaerobic ribonucleoside-triphosphate reductase activating protein
VLNIYNIETSNYVNGNGNRFVIWVQGCDLGCVGCWNQQTWSFEEKKIMTPDSIFEQIKLHYSELDGVTFTGGEPFLQSSDFTKLAYLIKSQLKLPIQVFSGFNLNEIEDDPAKRELLSLIDILVCGRFDEKKPNNNQTVYHLDKTVEAWQFNNSDVEIEFDENNNMKLTGYPKDSLIRSMKDIDDRV